MQVIKNEVVATAAVPAENAAITAAGNYDTVRFNALKARRPLAPCCL